MNHHNERCVFRFSLSLRGASVERAGERGGEKNEPPLPGPHLPFREEREKRISHRKGRDPVAKTIVVETTHESRWGDTLWNPDTLWCLKKVRAPLSVASPINWSKFAFCFLSRLALLLLLTATCILGADPPIRLSIEHSTETASTLEIRFAATPGKLYRIYESWNWEDWNPRQTITASADDSTLSFAIPTDEAITLFFRVEALAFEPLPQMVWIEPGEFVIGSPNNEEGRFLDKEEPQTRVILTRGYWIGKYEVTQAEFESVLGFNPSLFLGDPQLPVEDVSWFDAVDYCIELTEQQREAGTLPEEYEYRLPTEAEWAYAARAGTATRFSYGNDPGYQRLSDYAWYAGNSGLRSHPVGLKLPNPWGLYDMHGNVFEWCWDWFGQLPGGTVTDPEGPRRGIDRILRGGYWDSTPDFCRSAIRVHFPPGTQISYLGFRIVLAETAGR